MPGGHALPLLLVFLVLPLALPAQAPAQSAGDYVFPYKASGIGYEKTVVTPTAERLAGFRADGSYGLIVPGTGLSFDGSTLNATASGGTWGSIAGTLADQTDLQSALDGKQAASSRLTQLGGLSPNVSARFIYYNQLGDTWATAGDFTMRQAILGVPSGSGPYFYSHDGASTYSWVNGLSTDSLTSGTLGTARGGTGVADLANLDLENFSSGGASDGWVMTADGAGGSFWEALDADLTDLADGSLTGSKVGSGISAASVTDGLPSPANYTPQDGNLEGHLEGIDTALAGGASPGGSGSELQYRSGASSFGAVTGSSVSGANVAIGGTLSVKAVEVMNRITLPTPSMGTGWTDNGDGTYTSSNASGFYGITFNPLSLEEGSVYIVKYKVTAYTSGSASTYLGASGSGQADGTRITSAYGLNRWGSSIHCYDTPEPAIIHIRCNNGFVGTIGEITLTKLHD